jgi:hypothetical protein
MTIAGNAAAAGKNFPMAIRQISGAIARRIVCPVEPGELIARGKIYGMIKFGSRTELYLPADERFELMVKPGDKVKGGITVFARFNSGSKAVTTGDSRFVPISEDEDSFGSRWHVAGNSVEDEAAGDSSADKPAPENAQVAENAEKEPAPVQEA